MVAMAGPGFVGQVGLAGDVRQLLAGGGDVVEVPGPQLGRLEPGPEERGRRRRVGVGEGDVEILGPDE